MHSDTEVKTAAYYADCKERPWSHPVIAAFADPKLDWIRARTQFEGKKVLEVGGGNGYFSSRFDPLCDLTVLDLSSHQLEANPARTKVVGSVYEIPFADQSFDTVFCSNLLHHLDEPLRAVREMARVARSTVILSEPNASNLLVKFGALLNPTERNAVSYTRGFLTRQIENAGLFMTAHTYIGGLVMPNGTPAWLLPLAGARSTSRFSLFQILICTKGTK